MLSNLESQNAEKIKLLGGNMRVEIKDFDRKDIFKHYNDKNNPYLYITTKIDITNIYKNCKSYYASIAYFMTLAINQIDNFKYRYEDNKIFKYEVLKPNFTQMFDDNNIGFFTCDFKKTYSDFLVEYKDVKEKFHTNHKSYANDDQGEIWFSYVPWFNVSSIMSPFDKENTIPQFMWDKFYHEDGRTFVNLTIMVHHGFADAYHVKLFLEKFDEINENLEQYL